MSDISKIKVSGVEYDIKDIQAREDLGNLGTRVTELEQHGGGGGSTVELDTTLSEAGKAADAKAVGDALAGKQDAISDLEAIRTGAAKGTTAVQPEAGKGLFSGNYNDLTNKPTIPSVPKPLTYDYMPEGYPTKSVQTITLMEEQEVAFTLNKGVYGAPITDAFEVVEDQTYTVNWDGTEYECVGVISNSTPLLGNLSIVGMGDDTSEPFIYGYDSNKGSGVFSTPDIAASHTISVKTTKEIVTPMAKEFLPATALITYDSSTNTYSSDLTNDELRERLLGGKQVVLHKTVENEYLYLTKWAKKSSGEIDLAFAGDNYSVSLNTDGTIVEKPITET